MQVNPHFTWMLDFHCLSKSLGNELSLNLFFIKFAASSYWAGRQATISEHCRISSGPRDTQQRPHPAGHRQHMPGNVCSLSVRVGDKINESGVNLTWKENFKINNCLYFCSFCLEFDLATLINTGMDIRYHTATKTYESEVTLTGQTPPSKYC